jgi:D-amino-acid dehydrogenase
MAERFQKPFDFKPNGLLMLCKSEKTLEEEAHVAEMACKLGIPSQVLDAKKAAELEPDLRMDIAGAVHFPMDCSLDPAMLVDSLIGELEAGGVAFEWNCEATGWRTTGERITGLETKRKQIVADEFVVAGGSWTPDLVSGLGLNLPLQAGKGYSMTLSNPRQLPKACSILTEARVAVTPMAGKLRFAGTLEIAGNDLAIRQSRVRGIIKSIPQYFPDFRADDFDNVAFWSGLRPCSPDGVPYIGRFRRYANLSVAAGHAMMGVSLAPVTGEIIADIVSEEAVDQASITPIPGRSATVDLRQLSPDRFQ